MLPEQKWDMVVAQLAENCMVLYSKAMRERVCPGGVDGVLFTTFTASIQTFLSSLASSLNPSWLPFVAIAASPSIDNSQS
jgi:hypothetical protein